MSTTSRTRTLAIRTAAAAMIAAFGMLAVGCTSELPAPTQPAPQAPQQR